jgi:rubrerythrin
MFHNMQLLPLKNLPKSMTESNTVNKWHCMKCGVTYRGSYRCLRCGKPSNPVEIK